MDKGVFATFHWRWRVPVHASSGWPVTFGNRCVWNRNARV